MPALAPLPSPARVVANRANAAQSTGPRTEAGKARSRCNALQHGLAGQGIALPIEDGAAITAQVAAVQDELAPTTTLGSFFARRVALAMVRAERAVRHEARTLTHRIRHAAEAFDRERVAHAAEAIDRLTTEPRAARRDLLTLPEGVDALIETLLDLRACAARAEPDWSVDHEALLRAACGWRDEEIAPARGFALSRALLHDRCLLSATDRHAAQAPVAPGTPIRLGLMLAAVINEEVDWLRTHRATLDPTEVALDRAEAAERAAFDPSPAAQLARRYEAAAVRELNQSLARFHAVEAAAQAPETGSTAAASQAPVNSAPAEQPISEVRTIDDKLLSVNDLVEPLASFGSDGDRVIPCQASTLIRLVGETPAASKADQGVDRGGSMPQGPVQGQGDSPWLAP